MEDLRNPERQKGGIIHFIRRGEELHPDRVAIDDLKNKRRLTYKELGARVNRLSHGLLRLGVNQGDFVATMIGNEHTLVEVIFACAQIGAIVAPLNTRLIPAEIATYLDLHGCKALVSASEFTPCFENFSADIKILVGANMDGWLNYEKLLSEHIQSPPFTATSLDDPYRLVMTGGTTGRSKGVLHSQGGTIITVLSDVLEYGIQRGWKTLCVLPGYHVAGMEWGMFSIFARSGTVIFPEDTSFTPRKYIDLVREREIEYLPLVPAVINPLFEVWDKLPMEGVRTVVTTSAPTPVSLRKKLMEMFSNANIYAAAGLSESLNMATQGPKEFLIFPDSIGEPHIDTRVLILDEKDEIVPPDVTGHVVVRNFNTALGYHKNSAAGDLTWRPRRGDLEGLYWCFTGDIGKMDCDGRLTLVDRSKDIVKTGGETVPSVEVELVYTKHEGLRDVAVIGVPDDKWGEAVMLIAVIKHTQSSSSVFARELFDFGRKNLAAYKVPRKIAFLKELPRSHFGKVLKRELRQYEFDVTFERS